MKSKRTNRGDAEIAEVNVEKTKGNETSEIGEMEYLRAEGVSNFDCFVRFVVPPLHPSSAVLSATSAPPRFVPSKP